MIKIELWNHGSVDNEDNPCGEVEIFNISGERIRKELLQELVNDKADSLRHQWFGDLPTERALLVDCYEEQESIDGDGLHLTVNNYIELD